VIGIWFGVLLVSAGMIFLVSHLLARLTLISSLHVAKADEKRFGKEGENNGRILWAQHELAENTEQIVISVCFLIGGGIIFFLYH